MAGVAMEPSWAAMGGGCRRLVSPDHRKVKVLAAVAPGLVAGAVVGAAAAGGAAVGAAAGAVVGAAAAGAVVGFGAAAGGLVGAGGGAAGPQAANRPIPAAMPAKLMNRRRVGIVSLHRRMSS